MKVIVTGAAGQLGYDLQKTFADTDLHPVDIDDVDITDREAVTALVEETRPDVVIHSAAFTNVDQCESDPETAWLVNATGSGFIAEACARTGAKMVYISTDYVFDGTSGVPYVEFDPIAPMSMYGRSKAGGETLVQHSGADHLIVRTSWVHGAGGGNFAKTMLRLGRERGAVSVVDDQSGTPTFCVDLAAQIRRLIEAERRGIFHVTGSGHCTWFEFARAIFDEADLDVDLTPTDTASFGAPAPRPAYSVLDNLRSRQEGLPEMPHWRDGLTTFIASLNDDE